MQTVDLVLKNGVVVTPSGRLEGGVAIDEGKIVLVGKEAHLPSADSIIDVKGRLILPGMIDAHVHFRDPAKEGGDPQMEDFASGTAAAAAGGITTVFDMPGSAPPVLSASVLEDKVRAIQNKAYVNFGLYGGAGIQNLEHFKELASAGVIAFKTFMITGSSYCATDDLSLLRVFEGVAATDLPCSVHAETGSVVDYLIGRLSAEGRRDPSAHPESRPNWVEAEAISKALILSDAANARVHIAHMSTREGAHLVSLAKAAGKRVTVETCPQYLLLTAEEMKRKGPYAKINPPLRSASDVRALWEALRKGIVDVVASDHAPHTQGDKDVGFTDIWKAGPGMPGVETMLPLMLTKVNEGAISLEDLVRVMSESVSKVFDLYPRKGTVQVGSDADLTIVDMKKEKTIKIGDLHTRARNLVVYDGWKVKGAPIGTIVCGQLVMWEGEKVGKQGVGRFVTPIRGWMSAA